MTSFLSPIAHQVHASLPPGTASRAQLIELASATIGFRTYNALRANLDEFLQSDFCVLDPSRLLARATDLELDAVQTEQVVLPLLTAALTREASAAVNMKFCASQEDFFDEIREDAGQIAADSEDASVAMAETNAFLSEVYVEELEPEVPLSDVMPGDVWPIIATGDINMDQDMDKPFHGDKINFSVRLGFVRTVGNGLAWGESEASAGVDQTPWERDREDEAEYLAEQAETAMLGNPPEGFSFSISQPKGYGVLEFLFQVKVTQLKAVDQLGFDAPVIPGWLYDVRSTSAHLPRPPGDDTVALRGVLQHGLWTCRIRSNGFDAAINPTPPDHASAKIALAVMKVVHNFL
jgi:hypothetical protein